MAIFGSPYAYVPDSVSPSITLSQLSIGQSTLEGNTICQPTMSMGLDIMGPALIYIPVVFWLTRIPGHK